MEEKHPKGLYVLFATEMWERFSFYSMLSLFVLYLKDPVQGFGWSTERTTSLYSTYLMFVYASPLIGGWLADKKLGYRKAVMMGGLFFMAGHLLLSFHSMAAVYAALTCLVIGNGLFKPNVSTMVGNLYREGSHLKDRAYNIFYMGINVGAFFAPLVMELIKQKINVHAAFATAAFGMLISVGILYKYKKYIEQQVGESPTELYAKAHPNEKAQVHAIDAIPDWKRITALCVIFTIVIVFWMVFHQNFSTLTYWANDNTRWTFSGTVSAAINPFFVVTLTFPLIWMWKQLDKRGMEPSTPMKMAIGMMLTGTSFFILTYAARLGEASAPEGMPYAFKVSPAWLIAAYGVVTLGELMLSPMGLSLVSKVAPIRMRGLMMGGWFVATAIGNKLTAIGVFWDKWLHSTFFMVLGSMAFVMGIVLLLLMRPLKKAMPGV